MEEEQKIYTEQGVEAYVKYQLEHEEEPFLPGAAFPFVKVWSLVHVHTCHHCKCWSAVEGGGEVSTCGHFPRGKGWGFSPSCFSAHPQAPCGPWRAVLPSLLEMIVSWANVNHGQFEPFLSDDPLS